MDSSKEQIEAQLCAYIDGELSDAERAEFERHLATNPQHKALIAELRRHSGLLQDLPRASAPLELNEALCGQLERSALLNPSQEEDSGSSLSINRWPQITAVAAVLMLAIGLGVVVYYVLPPSGPTTKGPLAVDEHHLKLPTQDGPATRDLELASRDVKADGAESRGVDMSRKKAMAEKLSTSAAEFDPGLARSGEIKDGHLITAREVEELRKRTNLSLHGENEAFNLDGSSLCLVVSTTNAAAASNQVAQFFKNNRIQYMNYVDSAGAGGGGGSSEALRLQGTVDNGREPADRKDYTKDVTARPETSYGVSGGRRGAVTDRSANDEASAFKRTEKSPEGVQAVEQAAKDKAVGEKAATVNPGVVPPAPAPLSGAKGGEPGKPGSVIESGLGSAPAAKSEKDAMKPEQHSAAGVVAEQIDPLKAGGQEKQSEEKENVLARRRGYGLETAGGGQSPTTELRDGDAKWAVRERTLHARMAEKIADDANAKNGVIIARMNRRQANELSAYLSREQGQRAELTQVTLSDGSQSVQPDGAAKRPAATRDLYREAATLGAELGSVNRNAPSKSATDAIAPVGPAATVRSGVGETPRLEEPAQVREPAPAVSFGEPTTRPGELAKQMAAGKPATVPTAASSALHLNYDPLDDPVDVFIVVRDDSAAAALPQIGQGAGKAKAETAPAGEKK